MIGKYNSLIAVASLALVNTACDTCSKCRSIKTATDMQVEKIDEAIEEPRDHFRQMADNAILHDMSVADIHFVPHTAELSGTGAARLDRMATLLDTYGGTVRYETFNTDEQMMTQRLEHVREYLALTGCDMGRVSIKGMLSGGRGMAAAKAIQVELKGTSKTVQSGGSATLSTGTSGSAQPGS